MKESLKQVFNPQVLLPSISAGLVTGILIVMISVAFGALIFAGEISSYVSRGIGFILFSSMTLSLLITIFGSFSGTVMTAQDNPAVILALMSAAILLQMPASATLDEKFFTVAVAVMLAAILTGIVFLSIGWFGLTNLVRFIPHPVIGGFLAGTGLLLFVGSIPVMTDKPMSLLEFGVAFQPELLPLWLPGLVFSVALLLVLRRWSHFMILPSMLVGAIAVFYIVLFATGGTVEQAVESGWLLKSLPSGGGGMWQPVQLEDLKQVNWSVISEQWGSIMAVALISVIAALLNITGIELSTKKDLDLKKELRAIGLGNIIAGLGGGMPGYHMLGTTVLAFRMKARSRLVSLFIAALCLLVIIFGGSVLRVFPSFVLGGLLMFIALDFLSSWLYDAWFRLPWIDYMVIWLIMLVIGFVGFLEGVAFGLGLAIILFVVNYSRVRVVRHSLSGSQYHSTVERPRLAQQLLQQKGDWVHILELHGYLFFGTAYRLLEEIRERFVDEQRPSLRYLVLDFRLVSGIDASAALGFQKIKQLVQANDATLVCTNVSAGVKRQMKDVFDGEEGDGWRLFSDLDHGVEWCEENVLEVFADVGLAARSPSLMRQLKRALPSREDIDQLVAYFEYQEVQGGEYLIRQGDDTAGLYFIESGQVTVDLMQNNGELLRLRTIGAGTMVGEIGLYCGGDASASVKADISSGFYCLTQDNLKRMEQEVPHLAVALHRFVAQLMGERLLHTTDTLRALKR